MHTVPWLIITFLSVFIGFIVKGLVGFGDPLIYNPILLFHYTNSMITPGMAPINPVLNLSLVLKNRKAFKARVVLPITAVNVLGSILGVFLLKIFYSDWLKLLLGILIVCLGLEMLLRKSSAKVRPNPFIRSVVCFVSGIFAGLFGINLLFLIYMERDASNREEFRANACFIFFIENLVRIVMCILNGLFSADTLMITAVAVPAAFLGIWVGGKIDRKVDDALSKKLMIIAFILGGISAIVFALIQCFSA